MSAIRRHRRGGGTHETASDAELDGAFGLDSPPVPRHGDLLLVRNKEDGEKVLGDGIVLCRFVNYEDGEPEFDQLQFFGTEFTARPEQVDIVQKVIAAWV